MLASKRVCSASVRFLRSHHESSGPQWQTVQRQWHRQLSQHSRCTRTRTSTTQPRRIVPLLRVTRRSQSDTTAAAAKETIKDTATSAATATANGGSRLIAYVYGTGLVLLLGFGFLYITDTRASLHQYIAVPVIRLIHDDPEDAHHAGIRYIKGLYDFNLHPRERGNLDQELGDLRVEVFGHMLDNPIGTSAGIDKNAEIPSALLALGPALVEAGGATPLPQKGNDKPRVFRIPSQNALINRYGLNSDGAEHVAMQLRERVRSYAYSHGLGLDADAERFVLDGEAGVPPGSLVPGKILALQIAKNKFTPDNDIAAVARDYVFCVEHLARYADVLVVNVSSPNTPGLRDLQATAPLTAILTAVVNTAKSTDRKTKPAVMVKVSPDEDSDSQIEGICSAIWASGVDGVIVGNTTKKRPDPAPKGYIMPKKELSLLTEAGGYSGPQMFERTLDLVKRYRIKLDRGPQEDSPQSDSKPSQPRYAQQYPSQAPPINDIQPLPQSDVAHDSEEALQRDLKRLKPLTEKAEADSKRGFLQLPDRHTSQSTESKARAVEQDAKPDAQADTPSRVSSAVAEGGPKTPTRQAAEGALEKVLTLDSGNDDAKPSKSQHDARDVSQNNAPKEDKDGAAQDPQNSTKKAPRPEAKSQKSQISTETPPSKVIFATGGITNGEQCLEILNAGASVCQIYTTMMYGGVGTVTRMKAEMRQAISSQKAKET